MKNKTSTIALILSVLALLLALLALYRAETAADRREKELVDQLKPKMMTIYTDFDMQLSESERDPESLEELFDPMMRLIYDVM